MEVSQWCQFVAYPLISTAHGDQENIFKLVKELVFSVEWSGVLLVYKNVNYFFCKSSRSISWEKARIYPVTDCFSFILSILYM